MQLRSSYPLKEREGNILPLKCNFRVILFEMVSQNTKSGPFVTATRVTSTCIRWVYLFVTLKPQRLRLSVPLLCFELAIYTAMSQLGLQAVPIKNGAGSLYAYVTYMLPVYVT